MTTFSKVISERLSRLCGALALDEADSQAVEQALHGAVGPLMTRTVGSAAPWPSGISDDHTPIEFSLVLDHAAPQLRVLWEPQGDTGDADEKLRAGKRAIDELEEAGVCVAALRALQGSFLDAATDADFYLWQAARLWPRGPSQFKAYLNPLVDGPDRTRERMRSAFEVLGYAKSWPILEGALRPDRDEMRYLSLDLESGPSARLKVYIYHRDVTPSVLQAVAAHSPHADPDRIVKFFEIVSGGRTAHSGFRPGTCLTFLPDRGPGPVAATLHVPVRGYVDDDTETAARVANLAAGPAPFLSAESAALHERAVQAVASRPLEAGVGITTYLSLRSFADGERITAYLATELYDVMPPRT